MPSASRTCDAHLDLFNFSYPLSHLTDGLKRGRKTTIVAIGSSSTAGEGDVVPYPLRLQMLLRGRFPDRMIDVINRGVGGQEAPSELSRFEPDVLDEAPALVIWQVGTNAVFRKKEFDFDDVAGSIATGLRWLKDLPTDVVLMDLQYTTAVIDPKTTLGLSEDIVKRISIAAAEAEVNVFRRFSLMQYWVDHDKIPIAELVREGDPDQLHMSDWATNCVSQALFGAIQQAVEDGVT